VIVKSRLIDGVTRLLLFSVKVSCFLLVAVCLYLAFLFVRPQRISGPLLDRLVDSQIPTNLVVHVDSVAFGFRHGVSLQGLRVYDPSRTNRIEAVVQADEVSVRPLVRKIRIVGLKYMRLPDGYYAPENFDRNERVEAEFPVLGDFRLELVRPNVLGIAPDRIDARLEISRRKIAFDKIRLVWHGDDPKVGVDGFCSVDLDTQRVVGEVDGLATQPQIRPLLVALDVPVALPYMDAFTEVPVPVPSWCGWNVDLTNKDFDLRLRLTPTMGRYAGVPMSRATGRIRVRTQTRNNCLNYRTEVGPIVGADAKDRPLDGSVVIGGTNGYNIVTVTAKSGMPLADLLRLGGFTGSYVSDDVVGDTTGTMRFCFPRAMTNNYEVLNGSGSLKVTNGQLTRFKLFAGLTQLLAEHVPGVAAVVDQTAASGDYVIENGVLRSDNIFIEGKLFSIKMYGRFDAVRNRMDFTVRAQFTRKDSILGTYLINPVTWPFTKLLLEFRLTGPADNPKWEYVSVIDRVLEVLK